MAKDQSRTPKSTAPSETPQENAQESSNQFVLPQQSSAIDQWADIFHVQVGRLGVRLWFGTTRGDSSNRKDIRTAVFLPGEIGHLFLAHARAMAETQKIELKTNASPKTSTH